MLKNVKILTTRRNVPDESGLWLSEGGERGITSGDPQGGTLQSSNEPFGFYLFSLSSFRKQAFFGSSENK